MFSEVYARHYDAFNKDKPYKKEINFVYKWAEKPKWIFDIGAGNGSYWKYYPKRTNIFGIEKSGAMCWSNQRIFQGDIQTYKHSGRVDLVTALFDVINYIPDHSWWKDLPLDTGGYFIFDILNYESIMKEGFKETKKYADGIWRVITPIEQDNTSVRLKITLTNSTTCVSEIHTMYLYDHEDILGFCGDEFKFVDMKRTEKWQTWYRLQRK